jgi:hypothetical protein
MNYYDHMNNKTSATEFGDALIFLKRSKSFFLHASAFFISLVKFLSQWLYAYHLNLSISMDLQLSSID